MPRILPLLGALLVMAVVSASPAAASTDPPATASLGYPHCDDDGPWSRWGHDWWHRDGDGRYWHGWGDGDGYFDGNAYYGGCGRYSGDARSAGRGRVVRVMVAAKRLRGSAGCQHVYRSGRLGDLGSCRRFHWMRADGIRNWRFDFPRALPHGRYRLSRRAVDANGHREHARHLHLRIR